MSECVCVFVFVSLCVYWRVAEKSSPQPCPTVGLLHPPQLCGRLQASSEHPTLPGGFGGSAIYLGAPWPVAVQSCQHLVWGSRPASFWVPTAWPTEQQAHLPGCQGSVLFLLVMCASTSREESSLRATSVPPLCSFPWDLDLSKTRVCTAPIWNPLAASARSGTVLALVPLSPHPTSYTSAKALPHLCPCSPAGALRWDRQQGAE